MAKQEIRWKCPNGGCDREIVMEMDDEPKRNGQKITGADLERERREVERVLEKQANRHLEMCRPRSGVLSASKWAIPSGQRVKGPDEE